MKKAAVGNKALHAVGSIFGLALFVAALWMLHHEMKAYSYRELVGMLKELPTYKIALSVGLTILSYWVLTFYDTLAFNYIQHPLNYRKIVVGSFLGYVFSHNIGLSVLGAGAARYRVYSTWGISAVETAKVVVFCGVTFWLGFFAMGAGVFLLEPNVLPPEAMAKMGLPATSLRLVGVLCLIMVAGYVALCALRKRPIKIRDWEFSLPSLKTAGAQLALSALDWSLAASVLYVLLPAEPHLPWVQFLGMFLLAEAAGLASHIPGGLGVLDAVAMFLLAPLYSTSSVAVAMIVFRGIYYILPLILGASILGIHEVTQRKEGLRQVARVFGQWGPVLAPHVLAIITFAAGVLLLFSGVTPPHHGRVMWVQRYIPLWLMYLSTFLASLGAVTLMVLARGLQRRLDGAYLGAAMLLGAGAILAVLKAGEWEEATILLVMLAVLLPGRSYFYRKASLLTLRLSGGWVAGMVLTLLISVWLGVFSYRLADTNAPHPWWTLPRTAWFILTMIGAAITVVFLIITRLFHPPMPKTALPSPAEMDKVRRIVAQSPHAGDNLALLGDKALLFSDHDDAFIMYGVQGRSWVALGDPVGPREAWTELVWQYREMVDAHGGWTVFHKVRPGNLPLCMDLGLSLLPLGEDARVPLAEFTLQDDAHAALRDLSDRIQGQGHTFEVVPAQAVPALLPELKAVSDAWLAGKLTSEEHFSLGYFNEEYLRLFPSAIVRRKGQLVGFANLWLGAGKQELAIDLIRYLPEETPDVMDYLLARLMLWGRSQGYAWFDLGMAPLPEPLNHSLAPLWDRVGVIVFRHGEHFHSFEGLRQYKEKFRPTWEPRYLASPGGFALPRILADLSALITTGFKGIAK